MKPLTIHLEGGPDKGNKSDLAEIRRAFHEFLGVNTSVRIKLWGPRKRAYEKFVEELTDEPDRMHLLLVDSEAPLVENQSCWTHVLNREGDRWKKPKGATEEHLHFMAQCVEAWLVADPETMADFYGAKLGKLPKTNDVETIPKVELMRQLGAATRRTEKGEYHKVNHFPFLLQKSRCSIVRTRAPHLQRLWELLQEKGYLSA